MRAFDFVHTIFVIIEEVVKTSDHLQSQEISQTIYNHLESLLEISKRSLKTDLEEEIYEQYRDLKRLVDLINRGVHFSTEGQQNLKQKMHSFTLGLNKLEHQYVDALYNCSPDNDDPVAATSSSEIIGVADVYHKLMQNLMSSDQVLVTSLVGMPGIGKTALANKAFRDPTIVERFDRRVWVRLGKGCRFKDLTRRVLAEMDPEGDHVSDHEKKLKERLESERCLVVLDDVWDPFMAYLLDPYNRRGSKFYPLLGCNSRSRILVVSRLQQLGQDHSLLNPRVLITMRLLDMDESWQLLRDKAFSQGTPCPPQLEKAGKKIAENCEGLPLTILAVAALLSEQDDNTPEFWNEVAAYKNHYLFLEAYDEISEVLFPSYTFLPRVLQICFHFIGLFPQNYEVPRMKLINLWHVDGCEDINSDMRLYFDPNKYLVELVLNSLVMVYKESTFSYEHTVKTCGLHSSLWHLSNKIAKETKFCVVLNSLDDGLDDDIEGHHRLSFHNNVLFGIKDVIESVEDKCASTARSLLCFGPYHQYQVPICYSLELLRELDAVSIRFYEFPMEVLQLTLLKYLALTLDGIIPPSISQLFKLQFLTVNRHMNIKSARNSPSHLPVEIWKLEELLHLQVMGSNLPDPGGATLKKLSKLLDVSAHSCSEAVLKAIPNLLELRIRIELSSDDDGMPLTCFAHISHHLQLKHLKCVVVNPGVARLEMPFSSYRSVTKLSLSGMGYSWKEMNKIASIKSLKVLKLKNYAFQGSEWEVKEGEFRFLTSLIIQDTDMVEWRVGCGAIRWGGSFNFLVQLSMKHCYKLEKIDGSFRSSDLLKKVEIVDCNPLCVHEMKKAIPKDCILDVQSSWDATKHTR